MNDASRWRMAVAERLADRYSRDPNVRAFMVGGSTSRGLSDRYSDLEIGVFWDETPSAERREALLKSYGGVLKDMVEDSMWEHLIGTDTVSIDGFRVEVNHMRVDVMDAFLSEPEKRLSHPFMGFALKHAIALYGDGLVERWRAMCGEFPADVVSQTVRNAMTMHNSWKLWRTYAENGDLPTLTLHFVYAQDRLLRAFATLNSDYQGIEERWHAQNIAVWDFKPDNFERRLREVFRLSPLDASDAMRALVLDSFDLIETRLGSLDAERANFEEPPLWVPTTEDVDPTPVLARLAQAYANQRSVVCVARMDHPSGRRVDHYSLVELHVFWSALPPESERREVLDALDADVREFQPFDVERGGASEVCDVGGLRDVQVWHRAVESVERDLSVVLDSKDYNHSVDDLRQDTLAVLQQLAALHGEPSLREWQARCNATPLRVIERQTAWWLRYLQWQPIVEKFVARDEWLVFHWSLSWKAKELCETLRGLNGIRQPWRHDEDAPNWWVRWKHGALVDRLEIAPTDFARRFPAMFRMNVADAADELRALMRETAHLIDRHAPAVDTAEFRRALETPLDAWDEPPLFADGL